MASEVRDKYVAQVGVLVFHLVRVLSFGLWGFTRLLLDTSGSQKPRPLGRDRDV